jgi:hypothetical protein
MNQQHKMVLEKTHPSGADEWYCPICGRRLLMAYEPKFKKAVLEAGDEFAVHSGVISARQISSMQDSPVNNKRSADYSIISIDDPSLAPWVTWLDEIGFDELWDDEV